MLLSVRELEERSVQFREFVPAKAVDLKGTNFRPIEPLAVAGVAQLVSGTDEIHVRGHIDGLLEGECSRCLVPSPLRIHEDFDLRFLPVSADSADTEFELKDEDTEVGYYEGEGLELAHLLQEQLLLSLPMHWVCSDECRGFCPVCGVNRNRERCDCQEPTSENRWAALKGFKPSR